MAVDSVVGFKLICQNPEAGAQVRELGSQGVVHSSKEHYDC